MNQFVKLVRKNSYFKCHDTILIKFEEFICIKKKIEGNDFNLQKNVSTYKNK